MSFSLSGVALVTGAGGALGLATILQFAQDGVTRIAGLDISAPSLSKTATTLSEAFPSLSFLPLTVDLTEEEAVEKAIGAVIAKFGRIDYAVNNAAVGQKLSPTSETDLSEYDRVLSVNLRAVFICEKYELRQMEKQEPLVGRDACSARPPSRGAIVNVSSVLGFLAMPKLSLYNMAKHAVLGLTRTDALDFAKKQIRINAVCPGFIDTPLLLESTRNALAKNIDKTAQGRLATPQEVADSIVFLASDRASHITGISLTVDGGYSLS